jgi:hypothetical protein
MKKCDEKKKIFRLENLKEKVNISERNIRQAGRSTDECL